MALCAFNSFKSKIVNVKYVVLCEKKISNLAKDPNFDKIVSGWETEVKKQKTNKAMKAYLQRANEYDNFMRKQQISYELGKRHLANMMGEDPATFTQRMVDEAVEYLFPSGLFEPKARPALKPPEEIFPPRKAAQFDNSGRPFHNFFYTGKPVYYKTLFDVRTHMDGLKKRQNESIIKRIPIDFDSTFDKSGSNWMSKEELEVIFIEPLTDPQFEHFIAAMDRLCEMPYSHEKKDFIMTYRKLTVGQKLALDIPKPTIDENGRAYVTTYECLRRSARGHVTVRSPGTGLITINGKDISYFEDRQSREQVYHIKTQFSLN